ncbi:MAG: site-2 protease family protein [Clostridia bacterium]|nr:site-2 protease family protein [Clostridia bacterium]
MHILLALLMLSALIMVHEAGHFFAARACGMEVQEFAIGMGPALFSRRGKKGTRFSVRLFPIGGFCQFYGEDEDTKDGQGFNDYPVWKRAVTVASGPAMNFVLAIVIIVVYLSVWGLPAVVPRVAEVEENAQLAGLMVGDELLRVNGVDVVDTTTITSAITNSEGSPVTLSVLRAEEETDIVITPFFDDEAGRYRVGFTFAQDRIRISLLESVPFSVSYNLESATMILDTLRDLLTTGKGASDVTGPVGTVYVIQEATQKGGMDIFLEMAAMISVNLGVMNLLPIPGLDGSRLLFLLIEGVRRKPVKRELEGTIHFAGFMLLMGLMLVLVYKDIWTIVTGGFGF